MGLIPYIITAIIAGLGIFCGVFLGWVAKEELKPGKKYLILLQNLVLLALVVLFVYFDNVSLALLSTVLFVGRMAEGKLSKQPRPNFYYAAYIVLALVFFAGFGKESFMGTASLIFLFGLPTGSFLYMKKKWLKPSVFLFLIFVLISVLIQGISLLQQNSQCLK